MLLVCACGPNATIGPPEDAAVDGPPPEDAPPPDAPAVDAGGPDAEPGSVAICESCTDNAECGPDGLCITTGGGKVCLPRCDESAPDCPVGFTCGGVDKTYCAPIDGVCCVDDDGDDWGQGVGCFGPDCDDLDPERNPSALETCNTKDDDCDPATADGDADPAVGVACDGADLDSCAEGTSACTTGTVTCDDLSGSSVETCNGLDDDCDPATLDGSADPAVGVTCDGPDSDLCAEGTTSCTGGAVVCSDGTGGTIDVCNGLDDDCDPASADGAEDPAVGVACDGGDTDLCTEGTTSCSGGAVVCGDATGDGVELCNGLDDDCIAGTADGSADPAVGVPCDGGDSDLCQEGLAACSGGTVSCNDATSSTTDLCNGADDDCDPASADGAEDPGVGVACDGGDTDLCTEGTSSCSGGGIVCSDLTGDGVELCNGIDDDCIAGTPDGAADPAVGVACDGADSDVCLEGLSACSGGTVTCSDATGSTVELCNGANDDCDLSTADGSADPAVGVPCDGGDTDLCAEGVSACGAGGFVTCSDTTGGSPELCNGLDDDCNPATADGSADPAVGLPCDGADGDLCTEGVTSCAAGGVVCSDATATTTDVCNGVDDDCDPASADGEEDPLLGTACDGADSDLCAEGTRSCVAGALACSDATTGTVELCNGADDDCNAATADGSADPAVGVPCDGADGDLCTEGVTSCGGGSVACSDGTGTTADVCNGADDDCDPASPDGSEDPLLGTACDGPDSDLCAEGTRLCVGTSLSCSDATGGTVEVCNGADDDCNAATADGSADPAVGVPCDGADGDLCTEGVTSCGGSAGVSCSDGTGTTADVCNGADDDCDPASADGSEDPLLGTACDGPDSDLCPEGTRLCAGTTLTCSDATGGTIEMCNGADDDCNSATADGSADPAVGVPCDGADSDLCTEGVASCSLGSVSCSDTSGGTADTCNDLDDDCDPASADGSEDPLVGTPCDGADSDLCAEGTRSCVTGSLACSDTTADTVELCNGVDDDCNGATADGSADPAVGVPCDGADGDLCDEGVTSCAAGGTVTCSDGTSTTADTCNGADDDCDPASADGAEDPLVGTPCDGADSDLCVEGTRSCSGGGLACSDTTAGTVELCNNADDDCNPATADGSADPAVGVPCDGGDGDLCAEGATSCSGGSVSCSDATGTTSDLCNGLDDDCDPASADGSEDGALGSACDGLDGDLCVEGVVVCEGGGPVCDDETSTTIDLCNGANDDCDATSPDGSEDPALGGLCDGPDSDVCEEGVVVCSTGTPLCSDATADDVELCNAADDDCDGLVDEDFDLTSDVDNCGICGNTCSALCCSGSCAASNAANCGACGVPCTPGMLMVNELLIDPQAVPDTAGEWFEVYNPNAFAVDVRGFNIRDLGADTHTVVAADPVLVPPGGYLVLGINANVVTNGGVAVGYQYSSFMLGNSGDEIIISAYGTTLDQLIWGGTFDALGKSRELSSNHRTSVQNDTLTNWCQATTPFGGGDLGTPGVANACALP